MNSSSDILSGSQTLLRRIVSVIFLLSLFSLFLYLAGSVRNFTEDNLLLLLSVTGFSSAAVLISAGMQLLIVAFAFLAKKKVFWNYFISDMLLAILSAGILFLVSFVRVLQAGLSF